MSACIICLSEPHEAGEAGEVGDASEADNIIQLRYMLPCKCRLMLCDACVDRISACVYHRHVQKRIMPPLVMHVPDTEVHRENMFLRRCTYSLALSWVVFNVVKDVAYALGGPVYSLMISGVCVMVMFAILDTVTMSIDFRKATRSAVCLLFALVIVYMYWVTDNKF